MQRGLYLRMRFLQCLHGVGSERFNNDEIGLIEPKYS